MSILAKNKKVIFCLALLLMGFLDLFTTVAGVLFFGAVEVNPLLSGLTQTNMLLFIGVKILTVLFLGLIFYSGGRIIESHGDISSLGIRFFDLGYFTSLTVLTVIVTNNVMTLGGFI